MMVAVQIANSGRARVERITPKMIAIIIVIFFVIIFGNKLFKVIPAGHVGVVTLFGKVGQKEYTEGLQFPVNPLYKWHLFDARQRSHKETAMVPTQDQLQTTIDVSVQFRLDASKAPQILRDTGDDERLLEVHLVPPLRSILREQGKTVRRAEDFFLEETQAQLQGTLLSGLKEYCEPNGIEIQAVLIRDITLPAFISQAIESKKEREQAVEKQKAELERFKTEQQQIVAQAEAQRRAAEEESIRRKMLADAQAYEIEKITNAIGKNPQYIQLQSLEALKAMAKDPAAKIYFIDGTSPNPLPLLHLGEQK